LGLRNFNTSYYSNASFAKDFFLGYQEPALKKAWIPIIRPKITKASSGRLILPFQFCILLIWATKFLIFGGRQDFIL